MSQAPFIVRNVRFGIKLGVEPKVNILDLLFMTL